MNYRLSTQVSVCLPFCLSVRFKGFQSVHKNFQELKRASRELQYNFKRALRELQESVKKVSRVQENSRERKRARAEGVLVLFYLMKASLFRKTSLWFTFARVELLLVV